MTFSRRDFFKSAATSASTIAVLGRDGFFPVAADAATSAAYQAKLMPSQKEVWDWQVWMAKLGPKYTGNPAHVEFVEFLAKNLSTAGLDVQREHYTFPRWEAKRWELAIKPASGATFKPAVTSYFPYSGDTPATGVTGELVYAGSPGAFKLDGLQGKVALVDFKTNHRKFGEIYEPWGIYPATAHFPADVHPARAGVNDLTQFQKAGAVGVIIAWTDVSDANAADQYTPFSRPPQGIAGLYVGKDTGARLKTLAGSGAKATVVLEAQTFPDSPTDTLIATLPGMSSDEIIVVNTHTDGPNATEENGGVGILALAKYFSKLPKSARQRTMVFPLTTGHFARPRVPSIRGFIQKYPDVVKKRWPPSGVEFISAAWNGWTTPTCNTSRPASTNVASPSRKCQRPAIFWSRLCRVRPIATPPSSTPRMAVGSAKAVRCSVRASPPSAISRSPTIFSPDQPTAASKNSTRRCSTARSRSSPKPSTRST